MAVVGAGAAGLAAAHDLARAGRRVVVIEARDRIGGRILTVHDRRLPLSIELGAEFVHGEAPETERLARAAGSAIYDVSGDHWSAHRGTFRREDFWGPIDRVLGRIDARETDRPFSEIVVERPGGKRHPRDLSAAREFVQGFHAADLEQISARSIAPGAGESASASAARLGRVDGGYGRLLETLAGGLDVRLGSAVTEIAWAKRRVRIVARRSGRTVRIEARAAVVTVPIGVLQSEPGSAGHLRFDPEPPSLRAIERLAMGSVARIVIGLRTPPWSGRRRAPTGETLERLAFLHTRDQPFMVWWTAYPMRWPMLVGWCGGPPARELSRLGHRAREAEALGALARALGTPRRRIESMRVASWAHDWESDPWSRGAYSYVRVGGEDAAETLSRPVEGTLFFAGEATDAERSGTVEGALQSGRRAARQAAAALRRLGGG